MSWLIRHYERRVEQPANPAGDFLAAIALFALAALGALWVTLLAQQQSFSEFANSVFQ
jgi:hypothetical protein